MKTRGEILQAARALAAAVAESEEIIELQRCEAELGPLREAPLDSQSEDPRVLRYLEAKERAERLLHHVTTVFFFPLTGNLIEAGGEQGCAGCGA